MVEGTTLERWHTGNRIEGSNPSRSVFHSTNPRRIFASSAKPSSGCNPFRWERSPKRCAWHQSQGKSDDPPNTRIVQGARRDGRGGTSLVSHRFDVGGSRELGPYVATSADSEAIASRSSLSIPAVAASQVRWGRSGGTAWCLIAASITSRHLPASRARPVRSRARRIASTGRAAFGAGNRLSLGSVSFVVTDVPTPQEPRC